MVAVPASSGFGGPLVMPDDGAPYYTGPISFRRINMLEQQRKTYDEIEDLAEQFVAAGWLEPPLVAVLTRKQAENYLIYVNRVFGARHGIGEMVVLSHRPLRYAFMIAGHRRLLANQLLWDEGCRLCRKEFGPEESGTCFQRHLLKHCGRLYTDDQIEAKIFQGISPEEALIKQCSENHQRIPPAHEVADSLDRHFAVIKDDNPDLTVTAIARKVKVHPHRLRRALRYCKLPNHFREDVEAGRMSFGTALQLGRLVGRASPEWVEIMRQDFLLRRVSERKAKKELDDRTRSKAFNDSFDGLGDDSLIDEVKKAVRVPWERQNTDVIHAAAAAFRRAKADFASGKLGLPDSMYRDTTLMRSWRETIEIMQILLPELRSRLGDQADHDAAVLDEVKTIIDAFAPPEPDLFAFSAD